MTPTRWFIVLFAAVIIIFGATRYNSLVNLEEGVNEAWAQVETNYQRRADLIPNLVNTVRGARDFEQETLVAVVDARSRATSVQLNTGDLTDPQAFQQFADAQGQLSGALGRLLVTVERYPELRATENFRDLQVQLEGTENRINFARQEYNSAARGFNSAIRRFPNSMFAGMMGFQSVQYFEADRGAETAPQVEF